MPDAKLLQVNIVIFAFFRYNVGPTALKGAFWRVDPNVIAVIIKKLLVNLGSLRCPSLSISISCNICHLLLLDVTSVSFQKNHRPRDNGTLRSVYSPGVREAIVKKTLLFRFFTANFATKS